MAGPDADAAHRRSGPPLPKPDGLAQAMNHVDIMRPVTKFATTILETKRISDILGMAFREAYAERPQTKARDMLVEAGGVRVTGNPIKISGYEDPPTRTGVPTLNQHGDALRREFADVPRGGSAVDGDATQTGRFLLVFVAHAIQ